MADEDRDTRRSKQRLRRPGYTEQITLRLRRDTMEDIRRDAALEGIGPVVLARECIEDALPRLRTRYRKRRERERKRQETGH